MGFEEDETGALPISMEPEYVTEFMRRIELVRSGDYESVSFAECIELVKRNFPNEIRFRVLICQTINNKSIPLTIGH